MNRIILVLIISLILIASINAEVKYELSETGFNFGKTVQNIKVSHTFWIKSTGDDTLRIGKIDPGCGCTQAPIKDSILAPGDSTALEIILSTKSYRGYISKRPNFMTNASEDKVFIRIDAELLPKPVSMTPVSFSPYVLDVSQFSEKPRRKAKFLIQNVYDRDFNITLIDGMNKKFDIELPKSVKAGETVQGFIIVHEEFIKEDFQQSFTFELDDDFRSRFSVPVKREYRILKK